MKRRNTPAKQNILRLLEASETALSQDMIEERLGGTADRVTIYRILNTFCEDGLVHRAVSDDGKSYFARCQGCSGNHHTHDHFHFRCLNCLRVECMQETISIQLPKGYKAMNMNCWISGYCSRCAASA